MKISSKSASSYSQSNLRQSELENTQGKSKISYIERSLLRKHEKHLEFDNQKNIFDVIDSMEWGSLISKTLFDKAIRMLDNPEEIVLSDSDLAILITAAGKKCQISSVEIKNDYLKRLLKCFDARGCKLGIGARNALLSVNIDNGAQINPVDFLHELESEGLIANSETYGQLSRVYARNCDAAGIIELIKHTKDNGMRTNNHMLESLVYALASSGQDQKAKSVIEHTSNDSILADQLRIAYALAKAERFEDDSMMEILNQMDNLRNDSDDFLIALYEIVFSLATNGNVDGLKKISSFFPINCSNLDAKKWNLVIHDRIMRSINGSPDGNLAAAALLLDFITNSDEKNKLASMLIGQFKTRICNYKNIAEAMKICMIFEKCGLIRHSLRHYLREMAYKHAEKFVDLYQMYSNIDDFKELQNRPHLRLPIVLHNIAKLASANSLDEKCDLLNSIVESIYPMDEESCGVRYEVFMRDLLIAPILKEIDVLPSLLRNYAKNDEMQCFITDNIFDHLLQTRQMALLQTLLNGPLNNSKPGKMFPYNRLSSLITNGLPYSTSLTTAAKLLKVLFPASNGSISEYDRAIEMITNAIISSNLKKTRCLCEVWSKEKRIVLHSVDKDEILKKLDRSGEMPKKPLVLWLRQKSAWSDSTSTRSRTQTEYAQSAEQVKTEARNDQIRSKLDAAKITNSLHEAIKTGNLDAAREIWITGSSLVPTSLGLLLAEKLYEADLSSQFEFILSKIKERNDDIASKYHSCDASPKRITFLEQVSRILDLSQATKQQLLQNTRINALNVHIKNKELSKALDLLKSIADDRKMVYGQLDLICAAVENDDTAIITEVLNIIRTHHGKESSILDLCVALIEKSKFDQVKQLIENSSAMISRPKLKYYIDRELETENLDALLNFFELFYNAGKINRNDMDSLLIKIINHYGKHKDASALDSIEERLKKIGYRPNAEIDKVIRRVREQTARHVISLQKLDDTVERVEEEIPQNL